MMSGTVAPPISDGTVLLNPGHLQKQLKHAADYYLVGSTILSFNDGDMVSRLNHINTLSDEYSLYGDMRLAMDDARNSEDSDGGGRATSEEVVAPWESRNGFCGEDKVADPTTTVAYDLESIDLSDGGESPDVVVLNNTQESSQKEVQCQCEQLGELKDKLLSAQKELEERDEEVGRLSRVRGEVEAELEDLTASLFEEAHKMVGEANSKRAAAEKALQETRMQVEVLQAEVSALKTLVITSTPATPNLHLHPQIGAAAGEESNSGMKIFQKKHRRSPSHNHLRYGRDSTPPGSPTHQHYCTISFMDAPFDANKAEVDPSFHKEFLLWRENPTLDPAASPFLNQIYNEDINLCLNFANVEVGQKVRKSIEENSLCIEAVLDKNKANIPKRCSLLEVPLCCKYRLRTSDSEEWVYISRLCRNRITAVCDFLNYLRYIQLGLVKSSVNDVYWEIIKLRKQMTLARLGIE